jgi:hypothetical protein
MCEDAGPKKMRNMAAHAAQKIGEEVVYALSNAN